jgi:hypothetical protein
MFRNESTGPCFFLQTTPCVSPSYRRATAATTCAGTNKEFVDESPCGVVKLEIVHYFCVFWKPKCPSQGVNVTQTCVHSNVEMHYKTCPLFL